MPIYEYECKSCGAISEFLATFRNNETISCRSCGSLKMEKIMSAASFLDRTMDRVPGHTCCGREERCEAPPCSTGSACKRD
jgi:putative FmdB family regulatory protein